MRVVSKIVLGFAVVFGTASAALAKGPVPTEPYGTSAQQEQCVADMVRSLHGSTIIGPRGTSIYIETLTGGYWGAATRVYDAMVGRCMRNIYLDHTALHGARIGR